MGAYVKILPLYNTISDSLADSVADKLFLIVARLSSCINPAKSGSDGLVHELGGAVLFPCGAIDQLRDGGLVRVVKGGGGGEC